MVFSASKAVLYYASVGGGLSCIPKVAITALGQALVMEMLEKQC